jgi:hypothetical protein
MSGSGGDGCVEGDGVAERFELADELAGFPLFSGEKTKLAKPPISVTAVSACRRRTRNHLVTTVNAAS